MSDYLFVLFVEATAKAKTETTVTSPEAENPTTAAKR